MVDWNLERVNGLTTAQVKALRENGLRRNENQIVAICDEVLRSRKPAKPPRASRIAEVRDNQYVSEFHFVCPGELGVIKNTDGTVWSGTWVVADEHAITAEKYGAIVALHPTKAEPSYIQGRVVGWRRSEREKKYSGEVEAKTPTGIDFLIEPTMDQLQWRGEGSGEKGYAWSELP